LAALIPPSAWSSTPEAGAARYRPEHGGPGQSNDPVLSRLMQRFASSMVTHGRCRARHAGLVSCNSCRYQIVKEQTGHKLDTLGPVLSVQRAGEGKDSASSYPRRLEVRHGRAKNDSTFFDQPIQP
jgi:hypothetical protein